jgi:hypothetical protein
MGRGVSKRCAMGHSTLLHVGGEVDLVGHLSDLHLEAILHLLQHARLIRHGRSVCRQEGDRQALRSETAGACHLREDTSFVGLDKT